MEYAREYEQAQAEESAPQTPAYVSVRDALASGTVGLVSGESGKTANSEAGSVLLTLANSLKSAGVNKRNTDLLQSFREYEQKPDTAAAGSKMLREDRYAQNNMASPAERLKSLGLFMKTLPEIFAIEWQMFLSYAAFWPSSSDASIARMVFLHLPKLRLCGVPNGMGQRLLLQPVAEIGDGPVVDV